MGNREFINSIKAIDFAKYSGVSSREKLVVFTIKFLSDNNIPTTFDYVCMAAFRFFPEEFKLSNEFPEQADIAGLNRTLMHLRPSERDLATGKPNTEYELTNNGLALAKQVEEGLKTNAYMTQEKVAKHDVVVHKKNNEKYFSLIKNPIYLDYVTTSKYDLSLIWRLFKVAPFTSMETLLDNLKDISESAMNKKDSKCMQLCKLMTKDLKVFIERKRLIEKGVKK